MLGKILIVRAILRCERESHLQLTTDGIFKTLDFDKIRDSWLIRFWQMIGRGTSTEDIASSLDHITFVNFNYDRCIEHFLIQAFCGLDNWEQPKAYDFVVSKVKIFHPYGKVGPLDSVRFGDDDRWDFIERAKEIKTYTEQLESQTEVEIKNEIQSARTVIFLGFHFHRQNVDLLKPNKPSEVEQVYATAFGISPADQKIVRSQIGEIIGVDLHASAEAYRLEFVEGDCAKLFRDFEKTLDRII